jgi:protein-tyrosine phosphatase
MLPGLDDGARDLDMALAMARLAVADGITVTACTPHVMPGVYNNDATLIGAAIATLQTALDRERIALRLVIGSDAHMDFGLVAGLNAGRIPALNGSRYFLFEPPHHVKPPRLEDNLFSILAAGYVPVLTHPERLSWIDDDYPLIVELARRGVWMQLTAGSLTGRFGGRVRYWADRMLDEGLVHILATDAHNTTSRPPILSKARDLAAARLGDEEAIRLTVTRPQGIIDDWRPEDMPALPKPAPIAKESGFWAKAGRWIGRGS